MRTYKSPSHPRSTPIFRHPSKKPESIPSPGFSHYLVARQAGAGDGRPEHNGEVTARGGKPRDSIHGGNPASGGVFPVGVLARENGAKRHDLSALPRLGVASGW